MGPMGAEWLVPSVSVSSIVLGVVQALNDKPEGKKKNIFGKECFKISSPSADVGAERITEGFQIGKSEKIPSGPAGLGL